jgi:hypothetical protein
MQMVKRVFMLACLATVASERAAEADDPLAPWRAGVTIRPVSDRPARHTIHSYYLTCPECPDGSRVLFYASTTLDGQHGELIVRDRATGRETVIARDIETEDAHRAACQQWISGGKRVAYHHVEGGCWSVHVVDLDTLTDRQLAEDRQLGFGRAVDDILPIYGCHWNPGPHRDLELLDAATGEVRTALTIGDVETHHGEWLAKQFGGRATSIFFPIVSPDGKRVFFKMSAPGSEGAVNNFRSRKASDRQGLFVYELATKQPRYTCGAWGHPAWHPDGRRIIEVGYTLIDSDTGKRERLAGLPPMGSGHPSASPDGKLIVTDLTADHLGGRRSDWAVIVCDARGGDHVVLHQFDNSRGARSWRKNHPHPTFSADGRRIYFNVNEGDWTQLFVAQCAEPTPHGS